MEKRNETTELKNGKKEEKIKIAKKMKNTGIDIEIISSIIGLSIDEVNNL